MADLPTGTVTFLFTDIEGSTTRWEQHRAAMQAALARHDAILREAIEGHAGYVFKTVGDAFYAVFTTAPDALQAALATQYALQAEAWDEATGPLRVRIALHTGAAEQREGDYFGPPLNRVARLLSAGYGGQILLSTVTQELVRDQLPAGTELRDLGEHRFKDLIRPERVFQVVAPGLPTDFPPLKTLDHRPTNLPLLPTPFIGREREVETVRQRLVQPEVRLLTLTGPGGTGKTRLALESAAGLGEVFTDGVVFTPLAPIADPSLVPSAVTHALGLTEVPGLSPQEQLVHALHGKRLLLLLDNFEHLLPAASWVAELLATAPGLTVLVTSRVTLRLYGELEFRVPPLRLPSPTGQDAAELLQSEAVQLFLQRARTAKPDLSTTSGALAAIAAICIALDGLPLAIELAAARSKLFSPQAMLPRLRDRLGLLTAGPRNLPERQQTLRNTLDWSYQLLTPAEQDLFARLGVFVGAFGLEPAGVVCELGDDALERLAGLADSGLLEYVEGEEPSFRMLETVREYARARLATAGAEAVHRRHAAYYRDLAERAAPHLSGPELAAWASLLAREHGNLRAALTWLYDSDPHSALQMAVALDRFWTRYGHLREGRGWLEAVVERATEPDAWRGQALVALASARTEMGEHEDVDALLHEALSIYGAIEDSSGVAAVRLAQANAAHHRGDYPRATVLGQAALTRYRERGDRLGMATALQYLGSFAMYEPDLERASQLLDESAGLYDAAGDRWGKAMCAMLRGVIALFQGEPERGLALLDESLRLSWELGDMWTVGRSLAALALVAAARGEAARAARLWAAAEVLLERTGVPISAAGIPQVAAQQLAGLRERMGEERWAEAERAGRGLTTEEAVELALGARPV